MRLEIFSHDVEQFDWLETLTIKIVTNKIGQCAILINVEKGATVF
jgi:hypothetical protein